MTNTTTAPNTTPAYRIAFVCDCCLIMLANGDTSGCVDYYGHGAETHPHPAASQLPAPGLLPGVAAVAAGMPDAEHACGIPWDVPGGRECECERSTCWHTTRTCEGCGGSFLPGADFHAVTILEELA